MFTISKNTFKEFIRNKIMYLMLFVATGFILFTIVLSSLAFIESEKIIIDFSLSLIEIFGLISTIFLGSSLLYSELSKNTILLILSKSPSRAKFILGKFLGFSGILLLVYLILSIAFLLVIFLHGIPFDINFLYSIGLSFVKILVLLSILIFFSTFTSPFISLLISICVYTISHSTSFVKFYLIELSKIDKDSIQYYLVNVVYYLFPNFQDLSMKEFLLSPNLSYYSPLHILSSVFVSLIYIVIILFFAILIFNKKEF
ncbi:ABC transporter permease [Candidatus Vampirococcus lugosii]|uniref:ABC-type transport system involved in multi-copper enzyme maturation, permease component n=1 Tax=Candidatus Vampirococcus lugosii TaxID=2789015 RepID=A0ABS5QK35_9BACT|nr:ABC transporter permease [Candidatus Vampirococcus lugosii]MBS8121610.1 ABC-type transport system involved in multi-copper enzyme maturation, permease component [Candidatus Vampirococcus lugosii]